MPWRIRKGRFLNLCCNVEILLNKSSLWAQNGILKNSFSPWSIHMGSLLLQTCQGQWGAVREWVQGWISKTLRRWKLTSHELVSWWLENIYIGLQVKEYLDNLGVEYRLAELLGRMSKFWPQVFQIWVLSWKRSGSLSPPWRLLGRDQEGLHQGLFSSNWFWIVLLYPGLADLHHQLWRVQTRPQLPQGNRAPSQKPPDEMALLEWEQAWTSVSCLLFLVS